MKTTRPVFSAIVLGLGLLAFSASASARDHGHYDRYDRHDRYERHHHRHHYDRYYGRDVRVIERRYYERREPIYRTEPGVVVRIGLPLPPPIFIPFH